MKVRRVSFFVHSLLHMWLIACQTIGGAFVAVTFFELTAIDLAMSSVPKTTEQLQDEKIRIEISKEISETEKNKTDREKAKNEIKKINAETEKTKAETQQINDGWRFFWQIILPSLTVPVAAVAAILTWRSQIAENKLEREKQLEEKYDDALKSISNGSLEGVATAQMLATISKLDELNKHIKFNERILNLLVRLIRVNSDKQQKTDHHLLRLFEESLRLRLKNINVDDRKSLLSFSKLVLDEINFLEIDLTHLDFTKTSLKKVSLISKSHITITKLVFHEANLENSILMGINFRDVNCDSTKFCEANISYVHFVYTEEALKQQLQQAHFTKATLENVKFVKSNLTGVIFKNATIKEVTFDGSTFFQTSFLSASLDNIKFQSTKLQNVNFMYATLNKVTFQKVAFDTDSAFNKTRFTKTKFIEVTLDGVDFSLSEFDDETLASIAKLKNWNKATFAENHVAIISAKKPRP